MRAHGWDRDLNKKNEKNFNFVNMGFNLRPLKYQLLLHLTS